jgi:NADPH:quinone reductase-like Zn-dependent oxidoreductase
MKAVVWTKYGSPLEGLQLQEITKPTPKKDEVLIKIHATSVSAGDIDLINLVTPFGLWIPFRLFTGLRKPSRITILGQELAGVIEAVGKDVTSFKIGDQVFGASSFSSRANAEYTCLPEKSTSGVLSHKPTNMTYEEAAVIPVAGLNALHFMREGNIQKGKKVLINGAGGSIGTIAIQLAKKLGADVTAVDSTTKLDILSSIGADHVIDYTQEDFTKRGETYDVIIDVIGKASYSGCLKSLKKKGILLNGNPTLSRIIRGFWTSKISSKKVINDTTSFLSDDLVFLKEQVEAGKFKAIIDKRFPLEQIPEAHIYIEKEHKIGNVVIILNRN